MKKYNIGGSPHWGGMGDPPMSVITTVFPWKKLKSAFSSLFLMFFNTYALETKMSQCFKNSVHINDVTSLKAIQVNRFNKRELVKSDN